MKKAKTKHETLGPLGVREYRHDPSNVFASIRSSKLEAHFLFDRTHTFALLDRRPASAGHALLVVKHPAATLLEELPAEVKAGIIDDLPVLMSAVQRATSCDGIKVEQNNGPAAGQSVPQIIFHVKPSYFSTEKQQSCREREDLTAEEAGPLIARICNSLPESYSPGFHFWAATAEEMESVGTILEQHLVKPGMVVSLNGQLGAGKTTIARGFVRSFCKNPFLDVASPTYLLCLSYQEDLAHDVAARDSSDHKPSVHHMDPYRLGGNSDKMAGLIDFESAFKQDVCVIEWPDRMPESVMSLHKHGVQVIISGTGVQGVGRLIQILPLAPSDPSAEILNQWRSCGMPAVEQVALPKGASDTGKQLLFPAAEAIPEDPSKWLVLGVESSCDDTAAAVVRGDGHILSHRIASQVGLHEQYGGVKPDVARQAHADAIQGVVDGCLKEAGLSPSDLTAVAATVGPGLALCLQVGVRHALVLASEHRRPFLPIHHMEAHALITRMPHVMHTTMSFPALLLLVSGGHNMLVLCQGVGRYRVIGTSLDDSVGECFDKVARILGINAIPGGPKLEQLASKGDPSRFKITMPMQTGIYKDTCNFSFSGLKTSVARLVEEECDGKRGKKKGREADSGGAKKYSEMKAWQEGSCGGEGTNGAINGVDSARDSRSNGGEELMEIDGLKEDERQSEEARCQELEQVKADIAAAFQHMSVKFLKQRTARALQWLKHDCAQHGGSPVTCLVVAGGVAANKSVRAAMDQVASDFGLPCIYPPIKYCTDNGVMVAWAGVERLKLGLYKDPPSDLSSIDNHVEVVPRWPIGPLDPRSTVKGGVASKMYK